MRRAPCIPKVVRAGYAKALGVTATASSESTQAPRRAIAEIVSNRRAFTWHQSLARTLLCEAQGESTMGQTKRKPKHPHAAQPKPAGLQTISAQAWAQVCQTIRQLSPQHGR